MIEKLNLFIESISKTSGFSVTAIQWTGIAVLLMLLLLVLRKPWKTVQFLIVVAILGSLAYAAFDLVKIGSTHKKNLTGNPIEEMKNIKED